MSQLESWLPFFHIWYMFPFLLSQSASISDFRSVAPMDTKKSRRRIPKIQFRVIIIGGANAGKTTILQSVCDTTESPTIYRNRGDERDEVYHGGLAVLPLVSSYTTQCKLNPSMEVSDKRCCLLLLLNSESAWRARHQ